MKKILLALTSVFIVIAMVSCSLIETDPRKGKEKKFSVDDFSITLTSVFKEAPLEGFVAAYDGNDVAISVSKDLFSEFDYGELVTLDDYAKMLVDTNFHIFRNAEIKKADGLVYVEYTSKRDIGEVAFFVAMYRGNDAFWLVQYDCYADEYENYRSYFIEWSKTVTFSSQTTP